MKPFLQTRQSSNAGLISFNKRYFVLFENSAHYINEKLVKIFILMVCYEAYIGS